MYLNCVKCLFITCSILFLIYYVIQSTLLTNSEFLNIKPDDTFEPHLVIAILGSLLIAALVIIPISIYGAFKNSYELLIITGFGHLITFVINIIVDVTINYSMSIFYFLATILIYGLTSIWQIYLIILIGRNRKFALLISSPKVVANRF